MLRLGQVLKCPALTCHRHVKTSHLLPMLATQDLCLLTIPIAECPPIPWTMAYTYCRYYSDQGGYHKKLKRPHTQIPSLGTGPTWGRLNGWVVANLTQDQRRLLAYGPGVATYILEHHRPSLHLQMTLRDGHTHTHPPTAGISLTNDGSCDCTWGLASTHAMVELIHQQPTVRDHGK